MKQPWGNCNNDGSMVTLPVASSRPRYVAVEVKRRAGIDAVEQLSRYLVYLNLEPALAPVAGILASQSFTPQARTLAEDRGIRCLVLDYDAMRGLDDTQSKLF